MGASSLSARVTLVSDRVRELEREAVVSGISSAIAITRSHYGETIDLPFDHDHDLLHMPRLLPFDHDHDADHLCRGSDVEEEGFAFGWGH